MDQEYHKPQKAIIAKAGVYIPCSDYKALDGEDEHKLIVRTSASVLLVENSKELIRYFSGGKVYVGMDKDSVPIRSWDGH